MPAKKDWLVIADGEPLAWEQVLPLAEGRAVMVLDGAYTESLSQYLQPQVILGDLDSIALPLKEKLAKENPSRLLQDKDQNSTDLGKGLHFLTEQQARSVIICNATGFRMDHTLYNLGLLKRFHQSFESLKLYTAHEKIFYLENQKVSLKAEVGEALALLSFPQVEVCSRGLVYECEHLLLSIGAQESVSNAFSTKEAEIEVKGSALLLLSHKTELHKT